MKVFFILQGFLMGLALSPSYGENPQLEFEDEVVRKLDLKEKASQEESEPDSDVEDSATEMEGSEEGMEEEMEESKEGMEEEKKDRKKRMMEEE